MADCKKYEDYGIPLLNQGGWLIVDNYVQFTGDYRYQERICTINYVPNFHPNTITITGIANKELEISVLVLKNNNYVIAEMGWYENGHTFDIGDDYDKLGVAFRYADGSNIALNDVTIEEVGTWQHSLRKLTTTGWHDASVKEKSDNLWNYVIEQGGWMTNPGSIPTKYVSGQDHYYDRCRVPHMIPIPSNTMSFTCPSDIEIEFVWVNANGVTLSDTGWQQSGITVTAPESAVAMTFILRNVDGSACSPNDFQNIMLNTGSTALPYEPYWQ